MTERTTLATLSDDLAGLARSIAPHVVRVKGRHHGDASGVVWASDGLVVTASHALEREEGLVVALPSGESVDAQLIGRDAGTDLALLKLEGVHAPARFVPTKDTRMGELVVSIARPARDPHLVLAAVASVGEGWRTATGGKLDRHVQLDVHLPRGHSGAAIVNTRGEVLGVATAALVPHATVVVPTETIDRVVAELSSHGRIRRGHLGIGVYPVRLPPQVVQLVGRRAAVVVVAVEPSSPADGAGVVLGDVLLAIDSVPLESPADLVALLEERCNREVTLRVWRSGAVRELPVRTVCRE